MDFAGPGSALLRYYLWDSRVMSFFENVKNGSPSAGLIPCRRTKRT